MIVKNIFLFAPLYFQIIIEGALLFEGQGGGSFFRVVQKVIFWKKPALLVNWI